jgi:hypothetical protein
MLIHNALNLERSGGGPEERELGRVAKVSVEPSCLGCTGLPPAQRDAGYRAEGHLSSNLPLRGGRRLGATEQASAQLEPVVVADLIWAFFMINTHKPITPAGLSARREATAKLDRSTFEHAV